MDKGQGEGEGERGNDGWKAKEKEREKVNINRDGWRPYLSNTITCLYVICDTHTAHDAAVRNARQPGNSIPVMGEGSVSPKHRAGIQTSTHTFSSRL